MNALHFGSPVEVRAILRRKSKPSGIRSEFSDFKFWGRKELKTPRRGLYIGKRTLANGTVVYDGRDGGTEFYRKEKVAALLVVFNEREKPVYALSDDVTALEEVDEKSAN